MNSSKSFSHSSMPPHKFSNSYIITILRIMGTLAEFMICSWLIAIDNLSTESLWCSLHCEFISEHFSTHDVGIPLMGSYPAPHRLNSFTLMEASAGPRPVVPSASFSWPHNPCFFSLFPYFQRNNSIDKLGKVKYRMVSEKWNFR